MTPRKRGADALVSTLQSAGVTRLFALSGNHIMSVFDAALSVGIDLIHTRHEAAAVHMADAFSRVSGQVGVALVTGGPGHANAVSALYTARMAEAPLILLSGHAPSHQLGMGAFQEMAQAEIAAPVVKAAWTCAGADAVAGDVARAIRIARSGRPGPVHVSLPSEVLEGDASSTSIPEDLQPLRALLQSQVAVEIVGELGRARHPLILAGPACMTLRGRRLMQALERATGVPVVGMESPRGIADPCLGAFAEMLRHADYVLLVGKRLDFTLQFGKPPAVAANCRFGQIDPDLGEFDRSRRAVGQRLSTTALADAFPALEELARQASATPGSKHARWCAEVAAAITFRPSACEQATPNVPGKLHPLQALLPLQDLLQTHPAAVLVCDGGEFGQWAQACLTAPHRVINGVAGSIGSALPYAVGARCAVVDAPVVAVLGDGTFGFHPSEIDTAVRYKLPFVAVVGNDARWNAEYQIQLRDYGPDRAHGCDLLPTRYHDVAAAFGGHGEMVNDQADMPAAVDRARRSGLPACINVMIDSVPAPRIRRESPALVPPTPR